MNRTQIEWVKNPDGTQGITWNPISGCKNHTPEGLCLDGLFPCYAWKLAHTRLKQRYLANPHTSLKERPEASIEEYEIQRTDPFYPRFWEERLTEPCGILKDEVNYDPRSMKPKGIFVCDMSDLFGIGIPEEWTRKVLGAIETNFYDRFYLLTKQPQSLIKFSPFPGNCWVGVTATNHQMFVEACLLLGDIRAKVKYISLEPLLKWGDYPADGVAIEQWAKGLKLYGIDWLIVGACTGSLKEMLALGLKDEFPDKRVLRWGNKWTLQPRIEWVQEIVEAAGKVGGRVFLKNNLKPLVVQTRDANEYAPSWANGGFGTLRQEMPE